MNLEKQILEFLNNSLNWYLSTTPCLVLENTERINSNELVIFEVENVSESTDAERMRAIENILNSLPINETNFFYIIYGFQGVIRFFYGIAPNLECQLDEGFIRRNVDFSAEVLYTSLTGNFEDSEIVQINQEAISDFLQEIDSFRFNTMVEGTPGVLTTTNLNLGIDRISTIMREDDFVYLVIGQPFTLQEIACFIDQIEEVDNLLSLITEEIITKQCSDTNANSCSNNLTSAALNIDTFSKTRQTQTGIPIIGEKNGGEEIIEENDELEEIVDSQIIKLDGTVKSKTTQGVISNVLSNTNTLTKTDSTIIRDVFGNMSAREWRTYIQTVLYPRLNYALGSSLYLYSSVLKTNKKAVLNKLESITQSIYSGSSGNNVPIKFTCINENEIALNAFQNFQFLNYVQFQNCHCKTFSCEEMKARKVFSQVLSCEIAFGGNLVSSRELGIMVSLPNNLTSINPSSEYLLNDYCVDSNGFKAPAVIIGNYVKNGEIITSQKIVLTKKLLTHNIFLSSTDQELINRILYRILEESSFSYLVINTKSNEQLNHMFENSRIYDGHDNETGIFPINLFQFYEDEQIQTQVDFLKLCFQTVLPLSDALLGIVERGCYECYADYGWDIDTSQNSWFGENTFTNTVNAFPMLSDLIDKVKILIRNEISDNSIRDECNMELRSKLEVLLLGKKASIFNVHQSIDFFTILKQKSILNLMSLLNLKEREYYLALLIQKLYQSTKKMKEGEKEFHFITAWNSLHELFPKQNPLSYKRLELFDHYIEQATEVGLSYYLFDSTPSKIDRDILKQIPTVLSGRQVKLEDLKSIDDCIRLTEDQREALFELEKNHVLFSFDDTSFVYECECF